MTGWPAVRATRGCWHYDCSGRGNDSVANVRARYVLAAQRYQQPSLTLHRLPMRTFWVLFFVIALVPAQAQPEADPTLVHYVTASRATLYRDAAAKQPYVDLRFREPVFVQGAEGALREVRTRDGARGYVPADALSNVWIHIRKQARTLYVYRGGELAFELPIDLGFNGFADKERRGSESNPDDWRTPDGTFYVARKNPHSKFYRAFVINYPNAEDAARGLQQGLITQAQYEAIVRAEERFEVPPMNTALGGMIEIHGHGTGARADWTQGCVAVKDEHMDALWSLVTVGTPVVIEP